MSRSTHFLVAATLALFAAEAFGQGQPHEHKGFWFGVGLGGGVNLSEGIDGESLAGYAGVIRAGGTLSQKLLLAADLTFWWKSYTDLDVYRQNTTLSAFWYPIEDKGFYVQAGAGVGSVSGVVRPPAGNSFTESKLAFGTTLGAGVDLRLVGNLYLTPAVSWLFQAFGEIDETGAKSNHVLVGTIGVTTH